MPNHWHLVVWPRRDGDLSEFLRLLTVTHAQRWHANRRSAGTGHVYQGRFKSFPVQRDDHLLVLCRYVERNALRAALVRRAQDWRWCSLWRRQRVGAGGAAAGADSKAVSDALPPPLHEPWPVDRPADWLDLVNAPQTPAEEAAVLASIGRSRPLGTAAWAARTADELGLQWTLRPRGRPKKPPEEQGQGGRERQQRGPAERAGRRRKNEDQPRP